MLISHNHLPGLFASGTSVEYDVGREKEKEKKDCRMRSSGSGLAVELWLFRCRERPGAIFNVL